MKDRARSHLHLARSTPPTPPPLPVRLARTCMGTLRGWELVCQYPTKITSIQVDITFTIPQLIDGAPSHDKEA
jgi:hypothetical protein